MPTMLVNITLFEKRWLCAAFLPLSLSRCVSVSGFISLLQPITSFLHLLHFYFCSCATCTSSIFSQRRRRRRRSSEQSFGHFMLKIATKFLVSEDKFKFKFPSRKFVDDRVNLVLKSILIFKVSLDEMHAARPICDSVVFDMMEKLMIISTSFHIQMAFHFRLLESNKAK